jgi:hypothetical protein
MLEQITVRVLTNFFAADVRYLRDFVDVDAL